MSETVQRQRQVYLRTRGGRFVTESEWGRVHSPSFYEFLRKMDPAYVASYKQKREDSYWSESQQAAEMARFSLYRRNKKFHYNFGYVPARQEYGYVVQSDFTRDKRNWPYEIGNDRVLVVTVRG